MKMKVRKIGGAVLSLVLAVLVSLSVPVFPAYAVTTVHDVNAKWVPVGEQTVSNGTITTSARTVRMQIGFSTSGNDPIEPGGISIRIPKSVFKMHEGKEAEIEYPWRTNGDYTVESRDDDPDYLYITNKIRLGAATEQSMDITYTVSSLSDVWGNTDGEPFKIRVEIPGQPPVESTELKTHVVNRTVLKHVNKKFGTLYTSWQDNWDDSFKPDNDDAFWYGTWTLSTGTTDKEFGETGASNQAIKMWIEDNTDDGEIVGYSPLGEGGYPKGFSEMKGTIDEVGDRSNTQDGYDSPMQNYEVSVIVKYPKSIFQTDDEVTLKNSMTVHLKNDSDEEEVRSAEGTYTFKNLEWYDGGGNGMGTGAQKHGIKWLYGGVTMLDNEIDAADLDYRLSAEAYNVTQATSQDGKTYARFGDEFTMLMNDDLLYIPLENGPMRLQEGDYEASGFTVRFNTKTVASDFTSGTWKEVDSDWEKLDSVGRNPVMIVSGYKDGQWIEIAKARHIATHNEEGTDHYGSIEFFDYDESLGSPDELYHFKLNEGTGFSRLQWSLTLNQGVTEPISSADPDFNPAEYVLYANVGNYETEGQFFRQNWKEHNAVADSHGCGYEVRLIGNSEHLQQAVEAYHNGNIVEEDKVGPNGTEVTGPNGEIKPLYVDNVMSYFYVKDNKAYGNNTWALGTYNVGGSVAGDDYYQNDVFDWDNTMYGDNGSEKVIFMGHEDDAINSGDGSYVMHRIGRNYLTEIEMGSSMGKSVSTITGGVFGSKYGKITNDPDNKRVMIPWVITASSWYTGEPEGLTNLEESGLFETLSDGVVYDLLPLGMTLEDDSIIVVVPGDSSIETRKLERDVDFFVEHTPNYKDSGRELITIRYNYDSPNVSYTKSNGHVSSRVQVYMRTYYSWDAIYDYGDTFHNLAAFETNGRFLPDGEYSIPTSDTFTTEEKELLGGLDPSYTEIDGETPGKFEYARSEDVTITELTQARYGLSKLILGPESPMWGTGRVDEKNNQIEIPTGGLYQYRLRYAPSEGTSLRDMILYDALEMYDPDEDTKEKLAERENTSGSPSDTEDQGTVRWKGQLLSVDVTQPKNVIGVAPKVYVTCTEGFIVDEKAAEDHEGKVPTYHENKNLDVSNPEGSDTEWIELEVDPHTNVATVPEDLLGKVTGIAIDMRTGKLGTAYTLQNRQSVAVVLNMQGPTDPAEVRRLVNDAAALADKEGNTSATRPYTYNGVSMNAIVKHSNGTEDPGAVITNYYTRLTLRIPSGYIEVSKTVEGVEDPSNLDFTFKAEATDIDGSALLFSGTYYIIDQSTGYYVDAEGGLVNSAGYPITIDEEGVETIGDEKVDEDTYTHTTSDGTFSLKDGQRARLIDAVGDVEWVVSEIKGTDGFKTRNNVNNASEDTEGTKSAPFVIGDRQQSRVAFTNTATGELNLTKKVNTGSKTEEFNFTITLKTSDGDPIIGEISYTGKGGKKDGALTFNEEGIATVGLKDGESIHMVLPIGTQYNIEEEVPVGYEEPKAENDSGTLAFQKPGNAVFENFLTPTDEPQKAIEDQEKKRVSHIDLGEYADDVTYMVQAPVPGDAAKIKIEDTLVDAFRFVSEESDVQVTTADGEAVKGATVKITDRTLTVVIEGDDAKALRTKTVEVRFVARLLDDADLAPYASTGDILVPNVATVTFNDNSSWTTKPVTVTPPEKEEGPTKSVEGATTTRLDSISDRFTYELGGYVPARANKIVFTDTLEKALEFDGKISVLDGGKAVKGANVSVDGQTLTVTIENTKDADALTPHRTHKLIVRFKVRVKKDADLSGYTNGGTVSIPNTMEYAIDDESAVKSVAAVVGFPTPKEQVAKKKDIANKKKKTSKVINRVARTGDTMPVLILGILVAMGAFLIVFSLRRRKVQ